MVDGPTRLSPPTLGPYTIYDRLGVGALGEVFRAERTDRAPLGGARFVALKRLFPAAALDPETIHALEAEAELTKRLDHPSVVRVLDHGASGGTHFIVYELVTGRDLRAVFEKANSLRIKVPTPVAVAIAISLAEGLAYAHADANGLPGLVHRDVAPSNVLIGFGGSVKLTDFGIAHVVGRTTKRTGAGQVKGTARYMSPEQVLGHELDARTDLYSVGAIFFELATGRPLYLGRKPGDVMLEIARGDYPRPRALVPDLAPELEAILLKVLAHSRAERYDNAPQFLEALKAFTRSHEVSATGEVVRDFMTALFPTESLSGRESGTQRISGFPSDRPPGDSVTRDGVGGRARADEMLDEAASSAELGQNPSPGGFSGSAPRFEERHIMAEDKGGSDLDVFEGLAKKSGRAPSSSSALPPPPVPSTVPSAPGKPSGNPPPPPSAIPKTTLMGVSPPLPPPTGSVPPRAPPPPTGSPSGAPPVSTPRPPLPSSPPRNTPPPPPGPTSSAAPPPPPKASGSAPPRPPPTPKSAPPGPSQGSSSASAPPVAGSTTLASAAPATASSTSSPSLPATQSATGSATATPLPPPPGSSGPPASGKTQIGLAPSPLAGLPPPGVKSTAPLPPPPPKPGDAADSGPSTTPSAGASVSTSTPLPNLPQAASTLVAAVAPPPKPPTSIGATLGMPATESLDEVTPPKGAAKVDMDWEDDEESTHVFDNLNHKMPKLSTPSPAGVGSSKVGAAAALLAGSGGQASARPLQTMPMAALPPMAAVPPPPAIPSSLPVPPPRAPEPQSGSHSREGMQFQGQQQQGRSPLQSDMGLRQEPRSSSGSRLGIILGGLALIAVVGLGVYLFIPRTGQLKIDLKSKSGQELARAEIFVDGKKKCDTSPCVVDDLSPGPKSIKVIAPGAPVAEDSGMVEAGKEKVVFINIDDVAAGTASPSASASSEPAAQGTGFKVTGDSGIKALVDGKDSGPLPLTLTSLTPGDHKLKLDGGDRYEAVEKTVTVTQGQVTDLGETKLKVLKGRLTLELKTTGAAVVLASTQGGKKVEKKLSDSVWNSPPVKIDIDTKDQWKITATKKGFEDFSQDIKFDDGQADKTLTIELSEAGKATPTPVPGPLPGPGPGPAPVPTSEPKETPPSGMGTLNMNSIPVSKVLLDGKPMGSTPVIGKSVSAGPHTVTFISPDKGKKTKSVTVKPGETATAAVKFD